MIWGVVGVLVGNIEHVPSSSSSNCNGKRQYHTVLMLRVLDA